MRYAYQVRSLVLMSKFKWAYHNRNTVRTGITIPQCLTVVREKKMNGEKCRAVNAFSFRAPDIRLNDSSGKRQNLTYENKHTHIFIQYHSYTINKHKTFYKYWLIYWLVINATVALLLRGGQCHEGIIDLRYQNWPTKSI